VAVALGIAAVPYVGRSGRVLIAGLVPAVGLARMYVGAHLPLDIVGGAALGLGVEAASTLPLLLLQPLFGSATHEPDAPADRPAKQ
jgi:undecaprenyl-diphosphatase